VSDGPRLATTRAALAAARADVTGPVVLAPTMGALHDGHAHLLRAARTLAGPRGSVIVSIFVNPLQFGPGEDLDRYPRTLDEDLAICAREGADLVFAPSAAEMYPGGQPEVTVDPGPAGRVRCSSLSTTVSTPSKKPGLDLPSSRRPTGPGLTVTSGSAGYICIRSGQKTALTPSSAHTARSCSSGRG